MLATIRSSHATLYGQVHMRQEHWSSAEKLEQRTGEIKPRRKNLNLMKSVGKVMKRKVWRLCLGKDILTVSKKKKLSAIIPIMELNVLYMECHHANLHRKVEMAENQVQIKIMWNQCQRQLEYLLRLVISSWPLSIGEVDIMFLECSSLRLRFPPKLKSKSK